MDMTKGQGRVGQSRGIDVIRIEHGLLPESFGHIRFKLIVQDSI